MSIKLKPTNRGFYVGEFQDAVGNPCSIQESSLATEAAIWLGVDDPNPRRLTENGLEPVPFPTNIEPRDIYGNVIVPGITTDTLFNTRAHLTTEHVFTILTVFQIFQENKIAPTITFPDRYGVVCTISQHEKYLSLGPDDADPRICIHGWEKVPYPSDTIFTTHMLLDHQHVLKLTTLLKHFLKTGCLH